MLKTFTIFLLLSTAAWAQPWPQKPPRIGHLELKQEYWNHIKEAAQRYQISPYLIQAVCAIESRYDPYAHSGNCFGLMQLHIDTAQKYGVKALGVTLSEGQFEFATQRLRDQLKDLYE